MAMFGSSWRDSEANEHSVGAAYDDGLSAGREESKLKMIALLMDILKCRKDHATTLVDNHLKKNTNGNVPVLLRNGLHKSVHGRKNKT